MKVILDIETDGLKPTQVHCIVAKDIDTNEVYTFPPPRLHGFSAWAKQVEKFIMHNGISYDAPVLNNLLGTTIKPSQVIDTLILSQLIYPLIDGGHSLKMWGIRLKIYKGGVESFDKYTEEMLEYCKQDVEVTHAVYKHLLTKTKEFSSYSISLEHNVRTIMDGQQKNGFEFDMKKALTLFNTIKDEMDTIEKKAIETFPKKEIKLKTKTNYKDFNIGSRQQQVEVLISKGWKPKHRTEKGNIILNETILSKIKLPEAKMFNRFLLLQKRYAQIKSWIEACEEDGRVRGKVRTLSTVTGRTSANSPNMQQVPAKYSPFGEECRSVWTVKNIDTHKLVGTDASGLELRCLSHYMYKCDPKNAKEYINHLLNGDIHTLNMKLAGLDSRDQAKTFIYALMYGAGAEKIGKIVGKGKQAGLTLIDTFLKSIPALNKLRQEVYQTSRSGKLKGLDGRLLYPRSTHSALNTLIQGAGAVVCKQWLVEMIKAVSKEKLDVKLVASIHDEYQFEVSNEDVERFCHITKEAIKTTEKMLNLKCPLDNEYNVGLTWAETH
tara:strand:- start:1254 stop:2903 length:1650 start_codon:yes stop_codon:yes gene_type:complete